MKKRQATLCFLKKEGEVLLAMKKRGFGQSKYNGIGGKVEEQETIEEAAKREVLEEIGVHVRGLTKMAVIEFFYTETSGEKWCQEVHVFTVTKWEGEPQETEEMAPQWFSIKNLPFEKMWPDDPYWLPKVLSGESLKATFFYSLSLTLSSHKVVPALPSGLNHKKIA